MFAFSDYFKIKNNPWMHLPLQNKKAVLTTATNFTVSTLVWSQRQLCLSKEILSSSSKRKFFLEKKNLATC